MNLNSLKKTVPLIALGLMGYGMKATAQNTSMDMFHNEGLGVGENVTAYIGVNGVAHTSDANYSPLVSKPIFAMAGFNIGDVGMYGLNINGNVNLPIIGQPAPHKNLIEEGGIINGFADLTMAYGYHSSDMYKQGGGFEFFAGARGMNVSNNFQNTKQNIIRPIGGLRLVSNFSDKFFLTAQVACLPFSGRVNPGVTENGVKTSDVNKSTLMTDLSIGVVCRLF